MLRMLVGLGLWVRFLWLISGVLACAQSIYGWDGCLGDDWLEVVWVGAYPLSLSVWGGRVYLMNH